MAKVPKYELIYPDSDKIKKLQQELGDAHIKILAKCAADSAADIYYLEDEQEKCNQIYWFIYFYLLCYEKFESSPQTSGAKELLLQNQIEELERNLKIITQQYDKLVRQTSKELEKAEQAKKSIANYAQSLEEENKQLRKQLKNVQTSDNSAELNALRQENKEIKDAYEELNSQYMNLLMQKEI